ncbi:MAG: tyrosine-type recombinase/integrase [Burkholderiales bacterium]|nr:tyrosine-type recombinase/integrase [Burkholderiales bacterium]
MKSSISAAVTLAVETAMRQGELLGLRWEDIDKKRRLALLLDPKKNKDRRTASGATFQCRTSGPGKHAASAGRPGYSATAHYPLQGF